MRRAGSMVIENRDFGTGNKRRDKSANEDILRLTNENFKLTQRLSKLQEKLQSNNLNIDDVRSVAPTSVFKRISQRTLDRENKVKLMYGQPIDVKPTGFVDASFKDNKVDEWAESKKKKAMTKEHSQKRDQLQALSDQIQAEK